MFMLPLIYKHPKGQADRPYIFMKPHIHSSTCGRKVAGGEEPSGAELDLKQVPEGWRWVVVRWWGCCAVWSSLSSCVCCVCAGLCLVSFSTWNSLSCLCCGHAPCPSRPCSSATRSLKCFLFSFPVGINSLIFSAPQNFTPILLQHSHCLQCRVDSGAFLPSLSVCDLFEQTVCIWLILGLP